MPSTTSSSVSSDFASSTVITPSLPTFFIASARKRPISASPLAEMVPTWAISSFEVTFLEFFCRSATTASTARSTPRLRSIGSYRQQRPWTPLSLLRGLIQSRSWCHPQPRRKSSKRPAHHLGAHVLELVIEFDLLGDGDAVLGDAWRAPRLVEHDIAAFRA